MPTPAEIARQAETLDDEQWFEFLDELDEVSRRRQRESAPDEPADTSRAAVAAWVAKRHFLVDTGVREIWFLPHNAPDDEIRFLEVNDRLGSTPSTDAVEAIAFGLDVQGRHFRLSTADVNRDQLEQVRQGGLPLPPGWTLDGSTVWRRRQ